MPSAAAFARSGITRSSGWPSLRLRSRSTKPPLRREPLDHRVRPLRELVERQVAAQLDLHRALVRPAAHHLGRVEDPDLAAGDRRRAPRARRASAPARCARARCAAQRAEHHALGWPAAEPLGPGVADRREHAGHLGLREEPLPRRARGTRASPRTREPGAVSICAKNSASSADGNSSPSSARPKTSATANDDQRDRDRAPAVRERPVERAPVARLDRRRTPARAGGRCCRARAARAASCAPRASA